MDVEVDIEDDDEAEAAAAGVEKLKEVVPETETAPRRPTFASCSAHGLVTEAPLSLQPLEEAPAAVAVVIFCADAAVVTSLGELVLELPRELGPSREKAAAPES